MWQIQLTQQLHVKSATMDIGWRLQAGLLRVKKVKSLIVTNTTLRQFVDYVHQDIGCWRTLLMETQSIASPKTPPVLVKQQHLLQTQTIRQVLLILSWVLHVKHVMVLTLIWLIKEFLNANLFLIHHKIAWEYQWLTN